MDKLSVEKLTTLGITQEKPIKEQLDILLNQDINSLFSQLPEQHFSYNTYTDIKNTLIKLSPEYAVILSIIALLSKDENIQYIQVNFIDSFSRDCNPKTQIDIILSHYNITYDEFFKYLQKYITQDPSTKKPLSVVCYNAIYKFITDLQAINVKKIAGIQSVLQYIDNTDDEEIIKNFSLPKTSFPYGDSYHIMIVILMNHGISIQEFCAYLQQHKIIKVLNLQKLLLAIQDFLKSSLQY